MGKRALKVGELVVAHNMDRRPAIYVVPFSEVVGPFTFGLFLGGTSAWYDEAEGADKTFVVVLDSKTLRFGWVWANLIRRAVL